MANKAHATATMMIVQLIRKLEPQAKHFVLAQQCAGGAQLFNLAVVERLPQLIERPVAKPLLVRLSRFRRSAVRCIDKSLHSCGVLVPAYQCETQHKRITQFPSFAGVAQQRQRFPSDDG